MSVFRPAARVSAPDGREWEIYSYRIDVRDRGEFDPGLHDFPAPSSPVSAGLAVLDAIIWLVALIPRALLRLADTVVAGVRALRSDEWTIEAITFGGHPDSMKWRTTREFRGQVLAHVEGSLARGEHPRPRNARLLR